MRVRVCIMLAAAVGAAGSLILAVDMYRRLSAAEKLAMEGLSGAVGNANLVFGMTHVLGTAGLGILFLAVCLLLANERAPEPTAEPARNSPDSIAVEVPQATIQAVPLGIYAEPPVEMAAEGDAAPATQSFTEKPPVVREPMPVTGGTLRPPTRVVRREGPIPSPPPKPSNASLPAAPEVQRPAKNIFIVQAPPAPPPSKDDDPVGVPQPLSETEYQRAVVEEEVLREQGEIPVARPIGESGLSEAVKEEEKPGDQKT